MDAQEDTKLRLNNLLDKLEKKVNNDEFARKTFTGRALSRGDDSLHLATESGVVAIPISEIDGIYPIEERGSDFVAVDVRNGDSVTALIRTLPFSLGLGSFSRRFGDVIPTGGTYTYDYSGDTCTITGGPNCDATDDTTGGQILDDYWV